MSSLTLLLVGCGKMGQALAHGWLKADICQKLHIIDPHNENVIQHDKVSFVKEVEDREYDLIIFAVKPQILEEILSSYKSFTHKTTFVSIAAGKSLKTISNALNDDQARIIRVMPNTPAAIGMGISGLYANEYCSIQDKSNVERALSVCGDVVWLDDEQEMHALTALSGSGPAYVFHLIEAMTKAGVQAGLSQDKAQILARKTVEGSAALSAHNSDISASALREAVTSPNGTTQAGLEVLMSELTDLMTRTIEAAKKRSIELD